MPKFSEKDKIIVRNNLKKQVYKLIESKPLHKITIDELTKNTNIGKGSFYNFYENKYQLFFDVIRDEELNINNEIVKYAKSKFDNKLEFICNTFLEGIRLSKKNVIIKHLGKTELNILLQNLDDKEKIKMSSNDEIFLKIYQNHNIKFNISLEKVAKILQELYIYNVNKIDDASYTKILRATLKDILIS